eukprot:s1391_g2.t1
MSASINGEKKKKTSFEFPFELRRSADETVGLHYRPICHTDNSFGGFEVTDVLYSAQRQNEVLRRYCVAAIQDQTLQKGDIILAINGKNTQSAMTHELLASLELYMRVWRDTVEEKDDHPTPLMYVISEYAGTVEKEGGYLTVTKRTQIYVQRDSRAPPEEINAYRCDYIWGWHQGKSKHEGGWLPVDALRRPLNDALESNCSHNAMFLLPEKIPKTRLQQQSPGTFQAALEGRTGGTYDAVCNIAAMAKPSTGL